MLEKEMKTERIAMMMERSTLNAIDDWGFNNRVRSRAEAVRILVRRGIEAGNEMKKGEEAQA